MHCKRVDARQRSLLIDALLPEVLENVVADLADDLSVLVAQAVVEDVLTLLDDLQGTGILRLAPTRLVARAAMLTCAEHGIPFSDALAVTLAQDSSFPLLVADETKFQSLKALEPHRPGLRVIWIGDEV